MTLPRGATCEHPRMSYCCPEPCGHLVCPDCALAYDEGASDGPPDLFDDPAAVEELARGWGPADM